MTRQEHEVAIMVLVAEIVLIILPTVVKVCKHCIQFGIIKFLNIIIMRWHA